MHTTYVGCLTHMHACVASRMTWLREVPPLCARVGSGRAPPDGNDFILCSFFSKKFVFLKDNCILSAWDNHTPRREL